MRESMTDSFLMLDMSVDVFVGMTFVTCAAKQTSDLVGGEIRYHLGSFLKIKRNILDMMCLHNRHHDLFIDSQRYIYFRSLDNGRRMLIADRMAELDRYEDDIVRSLAFKPRHIDHKHRTQCETQHYSFLSFGIIIDYIAVGDLGVTFQCDGIFIVMIALAEETAFLCGPLVEKYVLYVNVVVIYFFMPFGSVDISQNFSIDFHDL